MREIRSPLDGILSPFATKPPPFTPAALFASGEDGAWYDPSDTTSLYQSRTGGDYADTDGDVVGFVLDKSQMGSSTAADFIAAQPELVTNGTFDVNIADWTLGGTAGTGDSIQWNNGVLEVTRTTNNITAYQGVSTTVGAYYKVSLGSVSDSFSRLYVSTSTAAANISDIVGAGNFIFKATATTTYIHLRSAAIATQTFDDVSVIELPGNHAVAASDAARPLYKTAGGLHWLEFDGVDDRMTHTLGGNHAIAAAMSQSATSGYVGVWAAATAGAGGSSMFASLSSDAQWGTFSGVNSPANSIVDDDVVRVLLMEDPDAGTFYLNGVADGTYPESNGQASSLGYVGGDPGQTVNGRIYQLVVRDIAFGSDQSNLESYLAGKSGVTL